MIPHNDEHMEAAQCSANDHREKLLSSLSLKAQEKYKKADKLIAEFEKLEIPFILGILSPVGAEKPEQYATVFYHNFLNFQLNGLKSIASFCRVDFLGSLIHFITNSRLQKSKYLTFHDVFNVFSQFVSIGANLVTGNPSKEVADDGVKTYDYMNDLIDMNLNFPEKRD